MLQKMVWIEINISDHFNSFKSGTMKIMSWDVLKNTYEEE